MVSGACWTAPTADEAACWTLSAALEAGLCTLPAALDAAPCTEPAALDATPCACEVGSWALPMTFSLRLVIRPFAAVTRRSTTRAGLTFSLRARTSWLTSRRVSSICRRMTSGSLLVMSATPCSRWSVGLEGAGDLLKGLHGALGLRVDLVELLLAHQSGDGADDPPEDRHDQRRPAVAHQVRESPPEGDGQEHQDHVAGEARHSEQSRTRAGLLRLGLDLHLGQLELLAHQGGEVLGDLAHQLADRRALDIGAPLRGGGGPHRAAVVGRVVLLGRLRIALPGAHGRSARRGGARIRGAHGSAHPAGAPGRVVPAGRGGR